MPSIPPKRSSFQEIGLTKLPYTQKEWRESMKEVKELFAKCQYRYCSARCIRILDNIEDPYRIHPLYSIWISFYAASSLEQTARPHLDSSNKLCLLEQSLSYYEKAESYMPFAAFSTDPTVVQVARQRSVSVSSTFRVHSDSTSPQIQPINSRIASGLSSPTSPTYRGGENAGETLKHSTSASLLGSEPIPSCHKEESPPSRLALGTSRTATHEPIVAKGPTHIIQESSSTEDARLSDFVLSRSLTRYQTHLTGMHAQLQYHIASVKEQISAVQSSRNTKSSHREDRFEGLAPGAWNGVNKEEMRRIELRMRIERLKKVGWKRERFDGERYRMLCKEVIAEIN